MCTTTRTRSLWLGSLLLLLSGCALTTVSSEPSESSGDGGAESGGSGTDIGGATSESAGGSQSSFAGSDAGGAAGEKTAAGGSPAVIDPRALGGKTSAGGATSRGGSSSFGGTTAGTTAAATRGGSQSFGGTTATASTVTAAGGATQATTVAAADCAAENYTGRVCDSYNDPQNPSVCLVRYPTWRSICTYTGSNACKVGATSHDMDCHNACIACDAGTTLPGCKTAMDVALAGGTCKWRD